MDRTKRLGKSCFKPSKKKISEALREIERGDIVDLPLGVRFVYLLKDQYKRKKTTQKDEI